jgi:MFS transporter, NNP family, nitrate/nitrite transporter
MNPAEPDCEPSEMTRAFLSTGHLPTLVACFAYFDLSFAVWVLLGPLAILIAQNLDLDAGQKGLMVAVPVLAGAVLRVVNGILVGQWKARVTAIVMQLVVILGLVAAWLFGIHSFAQLLAFGCVLGVAGASFAIALPMVSYWYPPEHQGMALGLAGAGNSGTVFASLFAPSLALAVGWQNVFGVAALLLIVILVFFMIAAKDSPNFPPAKTMTDYARLLGAADAWWLMFFYSVSFGGFVGLSSFLPIYFHDQYGLSPVNAGYFTAACVFAGSFARPFGGALADRIGGTRALMIIYAIVAVVLSAIAQGFMSVAGTFVILLVGMIALGFGNGAVFQLVPQRFGRDVGLITGLVGMTGGIGGFALAASLGYAKEFTGSYGSGFAIFAGLALTAWAGIAAVRLRWREDAALLTGVHV